MHVLVLDYLVAAYVVLAKVIRKGRRNIDGDDPSVLRIVEEGSF
jgi:hypothetical protein